LPWQDLQVSFWAILPRLKSLIIPGFNLIWQSSQGEGLAAAEDSNRVKNKNGITIIPKKYF
jgi:hypothetical protein